MMKHVPNLLAFGLVCCLVLMACTREFSDLVDVGDHSLYIHCTGSGNPTVILESAFGTDSTVWDTVVEGVKEFTRVCAYDRAGLGKSEPASTPRTTKDMVEDLHTLLAKANIEGPYVLVGWSIAGFNLRLYADQYPQEVAGMVFVDASQPEQFDRVLAALPAPSEDENQDLKEYRDSMLSLLDPANNPEGYDIPASVEQVRGSSTLGDIPLVVITAGVTPEYPAGFSSELIDQLMNIRSELQNELAMLSTNSSHVIADRSSHCITCTQPEIVVEAIRNVVEDVKGK